MNKVATWFRVRWNDGKREPLNPPNPSYPDGIDLDISANAAETCTVILPYPARRCGEYWLQCPNCGMSAIVTTAGRRDDPRSVKLACKSRTTMQ